MNSFNKSFLAESLNLKAQLKKELGLEDHIEFIGSVDNENVLSPMKSSRVLFHPLTERALEWWLWKQKLVSHRHWRYSA